MNEEDYNRLLARLIEEPEHRTEILKEADLDDAEQGNLTSLAETSDLLWLSRSGAPPLDQDPVAAMLGLIADPRVVLDSKALARQRKRARLTVSDLAVRLKDRGWDVQTTDVFRWETRPAPDVPPALVQAIATTLQTSPDHLTSAVQPTEDQFSAVRNTARFQDFVGRWMKAFGLSQPMAIAALESRMAATVHRGQKPDPQQLLAALDALVSAAEQTRELNSHED